MDILKVLILDDLIDFLDFWFHHFPKKIIRNFFDQIYLWDKHLKVKANLRNLTKPLFGDYSIIGHAIAFPYRIIRIIFGFFIYLFIFIFYFLFLLLWVVTPVFLLGYGILFSK